MVLDPAATAWLLAGGGAVGVVGGLIGLMGMRPGRSPAARTLAVLGVAETALLGVGLQSVSTIALAGYLLAMALPLGLIGLSVQAIRRYPRGRWLLIAVAGAIGVWGGLSGTLRPDSWTRLAGELGRGFAGHASQLLLVLLLALGTAGWALVTAASLRGTTAAARMGGWARRHRRGLTLVAAAGPLPYGLIRLTWVTPWPLLLPGGEALEPSIRLWGLLLGGGALLGAVLTVGLIRPWGVAFPRWVPVLAGRRVPPAVAVVPGMTVAGLVCASAAPMLRLILVPLPDTVFGEVSVAGRLLATLIFPFWLWGPALVLAVWGYAQSRWPVEEPPMPGTI